MGDTQETQDTGFEPRLLLVLGLGFGCLFGATGAVMFGTGGYFGPVSSLGDVSTPAIVAARLLVIVLFAALGLTGRPRVRMPLVIVAAAAALVGGLGVAFLRSGMLAVAAGALEGAGEGLLLYAWFMLLVSRRRDEVIFASLVAFIVAWASFIAAPYLGRLAEAVLYALMTLAAAAAFLYLDRNCSSCAPDGGFSRELLGRVPWFPACVLLLCSMLAAVLFGIVGIVFPATNGSLTYAVFAAAALASIAVTFLLMAFAKEWHQAVWIPNFVLLLAALLFSCFVSVGAIRIAVGFMMAAVFGYFFLRWPVFAAMVSELGLPRSLSAGVVLVLANGFFMYRLGEHVGRSLPESVFNVNGVAGIMTLLIVLVFAFSAGMGRLFSSVGPAAAKASEPLLDEEFEQSPADAAAAFAESLETHFDELSERFGLTPREREIAMLTAQGFTSTYIAEKLVISASTVRFHQQNVYRKLDIHSRHELIELANADLIAASASRES